MRFAVVVIVVLVSVAQCPGSCQSVTLDTKGLTLGAALEAAFKDSGKTYGLDAEVKPDVPLGDMRIVDVPFDTALRCILKTQHLSFRVDGQRYTISAGGPAPKQAAIPAPAAQGAERASREVLRAGMTSSEVKGLVGLPRRVETGGTPGREVYCYDDRIITFKRDRVVAISAPVPTSVRVKPSDKSRVRPEATAAVADRGVPAGRQVRLTIPRAAMPQAYSRSLSARVRHGRLSTAYHSMPACRPPST